MALRRLASSRVLSQTVCQRCQSVPIRRYSFQKHAVYRRQPVQSVFVPLRWYSVPQSSDPKVYDFSKVRDLISNPSPDRILIDVREPSEYQEGYIPSAINIPIKTQPDALLLPEEEFEDRFGFAKPPVDKEVIFYCKAGVRSQAAAGIAQQHGYKNVSEYKGSWMDWQKQGGEESKP